MRFSRLVCALMCFMPLSASAVKVGDQLPKTLVEDAAGKSVEPWAGKKALINFWATWCEACKVELKEMKDEAGKIPADRKVIFVSLDKEPAKAKSYFADQLKADAGLMASLHFDPSFKLADALGVESFPLTLIVDASGRVLSVQDGFKEGTGSTARLFEELKK